ncbi:hypothetical protein F5888DRAFT_1758028 [Russula emetica]|nr:hypothetical protein F5888DRAFT_1758028 [Russula emetica]
MPLLIKGWGSITGMTCQGLLYLHATAAAIRLTGDQTTLLINGKAAYSINYIGTSKRSHRNHHCNLRMACFNQIAVYESTFKDGI